MRRAGHRRRVVAYAGLSLFVACGPMRSGGGELEPRFVAVHNALAAMGLAQVGPIHEGALTESREAQLSLQLPAGCVTIAAVGGEGVRDLDATLFDPRGVSIAHDTTTEPQAVLRACLETPDTYRLTVKVASGSGAWIAATWVGGVAASASASTAGDARPPAEAIGTCEAPIPLSPGTVTGSTTRGEHENSGSCGPSDSRELVYELVLHARQRVVIEVEAHFDSLLYVRKDECADATAEVDCNDDSPDRTRSRIERVFEPGKYFVFVDGYGHEAGAFKMTVTVADVLALAEVCRRAPLLSPGAAQSGTTEGLADEAQAACGGGAGAADAPWRLQLGARSRVRLVEHSDDMAPVLHVRQACADERSEVACSESGAATGDATVTGFFDPGSYTVFADARDRDATGSYSMLLETSPPAGSGARSDGCGDALPLQGGNSGSVAGDTFAARDDVAGSCGGAGAPDVVYRVDVTKRSRFTAALDGEEAEHIVVVWRRCGDRSSEVACGRAIDEVLAPGTYFVAADGTTPEAMGRFTMQWGLRDVTGQASACAAAPTLAPGRAVDATTAGAGDRFAASCASSDQGGGGPDRVFRIVLPRRAVVRLAATAPGFDVALALRRACSDVAGTPSSEMACEAESEGHRVVLERALDAGTYWVVVDGQSAGDQGPFSLDYRVK